MTHLGLFLFSRARNPICIFSFSELPAQLRALQTSVPGVYTSSLPIRIHCQSAPTAELANVSNTMLTGLYKRRPFSEFSVSRPPNFLLTKYKSL